MQQQNNNTYNQPPQGEQMPPFAPMPPQMGMPGTVYGVQGRRRPNASAKAIFPQWLSRNALIVYFLALAVVSFMYSAYSLPWYYMLSGVVSVMVFFFYGSHLVERFSPLKLRKVKSFEKRIFLIAFVPRVVFVVLLYWLFQTNYGDAFGFENADALFYDELGQDFAKAMREGRFVSTWQTINKTIDISDLGYATYVGFVYSITDNSIIFIRLLKCLWSSIMVVLVYRLAKRNFGDFTARMTAIFVALWPNFWYYCSAHLKETEMVFLAVLFVEQADQMLRSQQFTAWKVIPVLLIGASLLTIRTPLALVAFLSLIFSLVMSSTRVVSWGKRIIVGVLAVTLIGVVAGNRLQERAMGLVEQVQGGYQEGNMEWRANRKDASGNTQRFARYAGKSVFAPLIFTIPFPTIVRPFEGQEVQQLLNGGNFTKNIISGFTIFAMGMLLISGKWREHLLPLSFLLGYLVVLTMSAFAHSERFHQPVMPFEFMFAAYGLSIAVTKSKYKRWFTYWCGLMFVACIAWNWFKLAGRGLA